MKFFLSLLFLLSTQALADMGFVPESDIGTNHVKVYYSTGACPEPCVQVSPGDPVHLMKVDVQVINGASVRVAVIDPVKVQAKEDADAVVAAQTKAVDDAKKDVASTDVDKLDLQGVKDTLKKIIQVLGSTQTRSALSSQLAK